ncbi:MAG: hypothetical protein LBR60_02780 [Fibrobacter sp.]|nr:hypothetical protein [Fibrobacter sp.]
MKFFSAGAFIFLACSFLFAEDMTAVTSDGRYVILKDDGHWMFYQNNSKIRDVRPAAIPEDMKANIYAKYESAGKLRDFKRRVLETSGFDEEAIRDSLRSVPKGGIIYFCIPTSQIRKGMVRHLTYTIWGDGKQPIFSTTVPDSKAVPSDDAGVSNLLAVPVYKKPKSNKFKMLVEDKSGRGSLEFELPIED